MVGGDKRLWRPSSEQLSPFCARDEPFEDGAEVQRRDAGRGCRHRVRCCCGNARASLLALVFPRLSTADALVASQLPLERASGSKATPRAPAGDTSACPVLNGGVSLSADVLQQMARHHGGDGASGASGLLLGTDTSGARVYASEADLLERDLRILEWHVRLARKLRLQAPPEVVAARDRAQAELKRTRGWW